MWIRASLRPALAFRSAARCRACASSSSSSSHPPSPPPSKRPPQVPKDLQIFREVMEDRDLDGEGGTSLATVHLNPAAHWMALNRDRDKISLDAEEDHRSLWVSVLGVPNAGKSTLVNALCGFPACPTSRRTHTTRRVSQAVLTRGEAQVVFSDTPGIVTGEDAKRFKLEERLVTGPARSLAHGTGPDLALVVQDVSNRFTREAVSKDALKLLCRNPRLPSVLVLNKVDAIPRSRRVYDLIRKLTCNRLEGRETQVKFIKGTHLRPRHTAETYLRTKEKKERSRSGSADTNDEEPPMTATQFLDLVRSRDPAEKPWSDEELEDALYGVVGWPGFREVFTVSATEGTGLEELRDYLLDACGPRPWRYRGDIRTSADPRRLVIDTVKAKLLELLPGDVAYGLKPELELWSVEERGSLLRVRIMIPSNRPRNTQYMLGLKGTNLRAVSTLVEKDLQDFFGCDVFVSLNVEIRHKAAPERVRPDDTPTLDIYI